jgi:hypothetical protein
VTGRAQHQHLSDATQLVLYTAHMLWLVVLSLCTTPLLMTGYCALASFHVQWGPTDCPVGLCWDPVTRTKFWGFVSMDVRAREFLQALGE